jgi:hypothetical protein
VFSQPSHNHSSTDRQGWRIQRTHSICRKHILCIESFQREHILCIENTFYINTSDHPFCIHTSRQTGKGACAKEKEATTRPLFAQFFFHTKKEASLRMAHNPYGPVHYGMPAFYGMPAIKAFMVVFKGFMEAFLRASRAYSMV